MSFNCWASNPEVQAWMAKHKYTDYAQLEQYYETTLLSIINDLDRGYVVWYRERCSALVACMCVTHSDVVLHCAVRQEIFDNGLKVRPDTVIGICHTHPAACSHITSLTVLLLLLLQMCGRAAGRQRLQQSPSPA